MLPPIHRRSRWGENQACRGVYSPAGYTVVQAALMEIYGKEFSDIMRALILEPLEMRDSTFTQPTPAELTPRIAVPYVPGGERLPDGPRVFNTSASDGLSTTPTDVAKFVMALQKALAGEPRGFITPQLAGAMMTRQPGTMLPDHCFPTHDPTKRACQASWGLGFDVNLNQYFEHQPDGGPTGNYAPQFQFLLDLVRRAADEERWP